MSNLNNTEEERKEIFWKEIFPDITSGIKSTESPRANILGGQPAAGKSHFIKSILAENENTVVINGDDFRSYHKAYAFMMKEDEKNAADFTQPDVNYWIENSIKESVKRGFSIVVEGTMKNPSVAINTAEFLKENGYKVIMNVITVNKEISEVDMIKRYLRQKEINGNSRYTKRSAHDKTVEVIYGNILTVAKSENIDTFNIFNREVDIFNKVYSEGVERISDFLDLRNLVDFLKNKDLSEVEKEYLIDSKRWIKSKESLFDSEIYLDFFKKEKEEKREVNWLLNFLLNNLFKNLTLKK